MQCEERRKVLRFNYKLQRHPKCSFRRALHVNKDAEVVVEGAELPTDLFIKKKGDRLNPKEKVSVITSPFLNSLEFPVLIPDSDLQNVHPFIKNLFQGIKIPQVPLAGRLKYFLKSWEKLTRDLNMLGITQGFQIPFKRKPSQKSKSLSETGMSKDQKILVNQEISDMLKKGAIRECQPHPSQLVSTLFLVGKKDGAKGLVTNVKKLNRLIPYQHFKMEGLYHLGYMLQQEDYMCKLDVKGVYFSVALHRNCRDKVCF